jgi:hypothetical protein
MISMSEVLMRVLNTEDGILHGSVTSALEKKKTAV